METMSVRREDFVKFIPSVTVTLFAVNVVPVARWNSKIALYR